MTKAELERENRSLRAEIAKLRKELRQIEGDQHRVREFQAVYDKAKKPATREHRWKMVELPPGGFWLNQCSVCGAFMRDVGIDNACPGPRHGGEKA